MYRPHLNWPSDTKFPNINLSFTNFGHWSLTGIKNRVIKKGLSLGSMTEGIKYPEDGNEESLRNVGVFVQPVAAVGPRGSYRTWLSVWNAWIRSEGRIFLIWHYTLNFVANYQTDKRNTHTQTHMYICTYTIYLPPNLHRVSDSISWQPLRPPPLYIFLYNFAIQLVTLQKCWRYGFLRSVYFSNTERIPVSIAWYIICCVIRP
jgi:hypothetical protein